MESARKSGGETWSRATSPVARLAVRLGDYLIGGTPPEPNGFVDSAHRILSDFRVRGTREAGERWWGLAALSNARGERGAGY